MSDLIETKKRCSGCGRTDCPWRWEEFDDEAQAIAAAHVCALNRMTNVLSDLLDESRRGK